MSIKTYASSEDLDQPGLPPSKPMVFVVRMHRASGFNKGVIQFMISLFDSLGYICNFVVFVVSRYGLSLLNCLSTSHHYPSSSSVV